MIAAIIQARMGATRLPGKVLKQINGKPEIFYVLDQTSKSKLVDDIIVATTTNPEDEAIVETVKNLGYKVFAGSEDDVLDRYYQAAKRFNVDVVVRITADCPLIDPRVIDKVIKKFKEKSCDYCSNVQPPTYPDGLDVEVFPFEALEKAWKEAKLPSHREHVTFFLWKNPDRFKIANVENNEDLSNMRLTVDEPEDLELISRIITKLDRSPILLKDIINLKYENPEIFDINKDFKRNEGHESAYEKDKKLLGKG